MFGLNDSSLTEIRDILKKNNVTKSFIFGSRAKNSYKKGSDIDLAIVGDEKKISYLLNEESSLPYYFDVVNLEKIENQNLKDHIARVGIAI